MRLFRFTPRRLAFTATFLMVLLALVASLVLPAAQPTATAADKPSGKPIKLAMVYAHSGQVGDSGKKWEILSRMAAAEINAAGGVNGSPLDLVFYDSQGDPQQAVVQTRKASADNNFAILGAMLSNECQVAFPVANQLQVPIIAPGSALPGLGAKNRPWAFRLAATDEKTIQATIDAFKKLFPDAKKFAIIVDVKDAWTRGFGTGLLPSKLKDNGYTLVSGEGGITIQSGQTDYAAQITKLKELKADAIGVAAQYAEAGPVGKEMKRQGINLPVIGGTSIMLPSLIQTGGDAVEGWIASQAFWPQKPDPKLQEVITMFRPEAAKITPQATTPSYSDINAYEAVQITADIMKKAGINGDTDLQKARTAIRNGWQELKGFHALGGRVSIGADGDADREIYVMIVKNGDWVRLE